VGGVLKEINSKYPMAISLYSLVVKDSLQYYTSYNKLRDSTYESERNLFRRENF
jgi:hypothetical protein